MMRKHLTVNMSRRYIITSISIIAINSLPFAFSLYKDLYGLGQAYGRSSEDVLSRHSFSVTHIILPHNLLV